VPADVSEPVAGAPVVASFAAASSVGASSVGASSGAVSAVLLERRVTLVQRVEPAVLLESRADSRLSAKGGDLWEISELGSFDVPRAALRAYRNGARAVNAESPACELPWTLLAGIGRVESDHGRYGGSVLGSDGVSRPSIRGVALNGVGPVAAIADSDGGRLDGDDMWDRAVGPMQFIPTTWATAGRDGDGDGVADPGDIDDAALAAAGYLCPATGSIHAEDAMERSVLSYNHSEYYVALVLAFEKGYRTGSFAIPSPPPPAEDGPARSDDGKTKGGGKGDRPARDPGNDRDESADDRDESETGGGKPSGGAPSPTPTPTPGVVTRTGLLTHDGEAWRLDDRSLDLGPEFRSTELLADYDRDGHVEPVTDELLGLEAAGEPVTLEVRSGTSPLVVVRIDGLPY
jgi:hypothetical protein